MNKGKEGAHFAYPNSFLNMLTAIRVRTFYLTGNLEGIERLILNHVRELKGNVPDFATI